MPSPNFTQMGSSRSHQIDTRLFARDTDLGTVPLPDLPGCNASEPVAEGVLEFGGLRKHFPQDRAEKSEACEAWLQSLAVNGLTLTSLKTVEAVYNALPKDSQQELIKLNHRVLESTDRNGRAVLQTVSELVFAGEHSAYLTSLGVFASTTSERRSMAVARLLIGELAHVGVSTQAQRGMAGPEAIRIVANVTAPGVYAHLISQMAMTGIARPKCDALFGALQAPDDPQKDSASERSQVDRLLQSAIKQMIAPELASYSNRFDCYFSHNGENLGSCIGSMQAERGLSLLTGARHCAVSDWPLAQRCFAANELPTYVVLRWNSDAVSEGKTQVDNQEITRAVVLLKVTEDRAYYLDPWSTAISREGMVLANPERVAEVSASGIESMAIRDFSARFSHAVARRSAFETVFKSDPKCLYETLKDPARNQELFDVISVSRQLADTFSKFPFSIEQLLSDDLAPMRSDFRTSGIWRDAFNRAFFLPAYPARIDEYAQYVASDWSIEAMRAGLAASPSLKEKRGFLEKAAKAVIAAGEVEEYRSTDQSRNVYLRSVLTLHGAENLAVNYVGHASPWVRTVAAEALAQCRHPALRAFGSVLLTSTAVESADSPRAVPERPSTFARFRNALWARWTIKPEVPHL